VLQVPRSHEVFYHLRNTNHLHAVKKEDRMGFDIGIIGGNGRMGRMLQRLFAQGGHRLHIVDIGTSLTIEECAHRCQMIIVAVPTDRAEEVIKTVGPLMHKESCLVDIISLKTGPLKTMLQYATCEVVGTHPVFGPGVKDFLNQTMVLCPGRGETWKHRLHGLFTSSGMKVKECTAAEHDKMMAIIQGMIHFSTITMGHAFKALNFDIEESLQFSSPIYRIRLDMIGRILNQSAELYADIEMQNPLTAEVLQQYLASSEKLFSIIKSGSREDFISFFNEAAEYLGDFRNIAEKESNFLVDTLAHVR
jgi:prephenate dehydrogenase